MMRRHSLVVWTGALMVLCFATGSWGAEVKAALPTAASAVSAGQPAAKAVPPSAPEGSGAPGAAQPFSYRASGKADPFKPFMETSPVPAKKIDKVRAVKGRPISPLQQAEIDQFRLVGIAGDDVRRTAVVEDAVAKKHYPLFVGTYIGPSGGRVVSILPDRVIVEERIQDPAQPKKGKTRRVTVVLHKEEEEGKP
jgi:Tfp pilus assembly protein PilP